MSQTAGKSMGKGKIEMKKLRRQSQHRGRGTPTRPAPLCRRPFNIDAATWRALFKKGPPVTAAECHAHASSGSGVGQGAARGGGARDTENRAQDTEHRAQESRQQVLVWLHSCSGVNAPGAKWQRGAHNHYRAKVPLREQANERIFIPGSGCSGRANPRLQPGKFITLLKCFIKRHKLGGSVLMKYAPGTHTTQFLGGHFKWVLAPRNLQLAAAAANTENWKKKKNEPGTGC